MDCCCGGGVGGVVIVMDVVGVDVIAFVVVVVTDPVGVVAVVVVSSLVHFLLYPFYSLHYSPYHFSSLLSLSFIIIALSSHLQWSIPSSPSTSTQTQPKPTLPYPPLSSIDHLALTFR